MVAQRAALEDEAVAYEVAAEAAITAELAADVAGANAAVIAAAATGVTGVALATAAAKAYRLVVPDMEGVGYEHALIGATLGRRQARVVTDTEGRRGRPTRDDPEVGDAVRALDSRAQDRLDLTVAWTRHLSMDTPDDVSAVTSRAYSAVTRARADARWIATRSVSLGVAQIAADLGWQTMWVPERNACLQCLAYAGLVTEPWDLFPAGLTFADRPSTLEAVPYPPLHPNCLPGNTMISTRSRVTGATSRVFHGEMVEICTLSDERFAATPNHPVLTDHGWVPIGELCEGLQVVRYSGTQRPGGVDEYGDRVPARIQDVAKTFLSASQVSPRVVPVSSEDFHGDGTGSEVAVVGAYSRLPVPVGQPLRNDVLQGRSARLPAFSALRSQGAFGNADPSAAYCFVGGSGSPLSLFGACSRHASEHSLASASRGHTLVRESTPNSGARDGVSLAQRLLALSGEVSLDQVVNVRRYPFSGHVFNLETEEGWYIGNSIVTHNCRCRIEPYNGPSPRLDRSDPSPASDLAREARRSVVKGWSDYDSEPARISAADRLIRRGAALPPTVVATALRAIRRGVFRR